VDVIGENGEQEYYTDANGVQQEEKLIILWGYNAAVDDLTLLNGFGTIFDLQQDSSEFYKELLKACTRIFVGGPSIFNLRSMLAAFLGVPVCTEPEEVVQEYFEDSYNKVVVTDKGVYKFDKAYSFITGLAVGKTYYAGDIFIDELEYYDNVSQPNWWRSKISSRLAISQYLFLGNYQGQLVFKNDVAPLSVDFSGVVHFPVEGLPVDVATFHANLDQTAIKTIYDLGPGDVTVINPVDFLFENFMKPNTAMIRFNILVRQDALKFFDFMYLLQPHLPKHIYFIISIDGTLEDEEYSQLNEALNIEYPSETRLLSCDGGNTVGFIDNVLPQEVVDNPGDAQIFLLNKLLSKAKSPSLADIEVRVGNGLSGGDLQVVAGAVFSTIPVGATSRQIRNLMLIDYV